ncbi:MAG: hypothetical protein WAZ12_01915 [Candidatus Absconditicoccaceae bacterium]
MTKTQILTEEHHRRPRSLDGTSAPGNISLIVKKRHMAWHVLVGNMNANQICDYFDHSSLKPKNLKVICSFINGSPVTKSGENNSKKESKVSRAWNILFEGLTFKEIIEYVNNTFLDPSYHLYLVEITENE